MDLSFLSRTTSAISMFLKISQFPPLISSCAHISVSYTPPLNPFLPPRNLCEILNQRKTLRMDSRKNGYTLVIYFHETHSSSAMASMMWWRHMLMIWWDMLKLLAYSPELALDSSAIIRITLSVNMLISLLLSFTYLCHGSNSETPKAA